METNLNRFGGMSVIVTGAASGIGKATVERFLSEGANVTALGHHRDKLEAAFEDADADRLQLLGGDVADADLAPQVVAAAVDRFGGLDILVNNAGMGTGGTVEEISLEDWNRQMAVNVTGYFLMAKAALPEIRKTRGAIVMTSSVSGLGGDWSFVGYNASKGAVGNMVRAMALDHAHEGIRVNAVCPSMTKHRHDRGHERRHAGKIPRAHPVGPPRRAGGDRRRDRLPRQQGCGLGERREPARRRRPQRQQRPAAAGVSERRSHRSTDFCPSARSIRSLGVEISAAEPSAHFAMEACQEIQRRHSFTFAQPSGFRWSRTVAPDPHSAPHTTLISTKASLPSLLKAIWESDKSECLKPSSTAFRIDAPAPMDSEGSTGLHCEPSTSTSFFVLSRTSESDFGPWVSVSSENVSPSVQSSIPDFPT